MMLASASTEYEPEPCLNASGAKDIAAIKAAATGSTSSGRDSGQGDESDGSESGKENLFPGRNRAQVKSGSEESAEELGSMFSEEEIEIAALPTDEDSPVLPTSPVTKLPRPIATPPGRRSSIPKSKFVPERRFPTTIRRESLDCNILTNNIPAEKVAQRKLSLQSSKLKTPQNRAAPAVKCNSSFMARSHMNTSQSGDMKLFSQQPSPKLGQSFSAAKFGTPIPAVKKSASLQTISWTAPGGTSSKHSKQPILDVYGLAVGQGISSSELLDDAFKAMDLSGIKYRSKMHKNLMNGQLYARLTFQDYTDTLNVLLGKSKLTENPAFQNLRFSKPL